MKVYFAQSTTMYNTPLQKECIKLIENTFLGAEVVNPQYLKIDIPEKYNQKESTKESYRMNHLFLPTLDNSDVFVYHLHEGVLTPGVSQEVDRTLSCKKKIYRIFNVNGQLEIHDMSDKSFIKKNVHEIYNAGFNKKWALPTGHEYSLWFSNNPETIDLIKSQFVKIENKGEWIRQAMMTHESTVHATNNFNNILLNESCTEKHNFMKHCFLDPRYQEKLATCIYTGESKIHPRWHGTKLECPDLMTEKEFLYYIASSRTIHGSTFLFTERAFKEGGGVYQRDKNGVLIRNEKTKKKIVDMSTVKGIRPVFDFDILAEIKSSAKDPFFNKVLFNQFDKVKELFNDYMEKVYTDTEFKMGYTGKGMYGILEPLLFEPYNKTFPEVKKDLAIDVAQLENIFKRNGIDKIKVDMTLGWSRYFKTIGTFHLAEERVSIPLNKDEPLDYKWMNEITNIRTGLEQNIMSEAIKRAEWR